MTYVSQEWRYKPVKIATMKWHLRRHQLGSGIHRYDKAAQSHQERSRNKNRLPSSLIDPDHSWDRRQKHAMR